MIGGGPAVAASEVRVETVALDAHGARQIAGRQRTTVPLGERADEVRDAIVQASVIAQQSLDQVPQHEAWKVTSMEVGFGLILGAESSVILSRSSAEASFTVTLTVERSPETP